MAPTSMRLPLLLIAFFAAQIATARAEETAALARLGADAWHSKGFKGGGITIAILDSGFRGYRDFLGKAIPKQVLAKSFRNDGELESRDGTHGLLCAEVVHAVAPEAELLFANWEPDSPAAFLQAVRWCRERGATIVSCSMIMPGWSDGRGGGAIHRELTQTMSGALLFASAGNLAQRHWNGEFRGEGGTIHHWKSTRTDNAIRPWGGQPVSVELSGPATSNYKLWVRDEAQNSPGVLQSLTVDGVHGSVVRFLPQSGRRYCAAVEKLAGAGGEFRLIVLGAELEFATDDGCMVFPGDGPDVITVGAVWPDGKRLSTSSKGHQNLIVKPDCVAPVPFPCQVRATPFGGTSAAAPQAAGMTALLWSRDPTADCGTIAARLRGHCIDLGTSGPDLDTGHGQIKLPKP